MTDRPAWNYFMYDDAGNWRYNFEYIVFSEYDIQSAEYQADYELWSEKFYWSAEEAAALSFTRDPKKIDWRDGADEGDVESQELWQQILALKSLIESAQEKGVLPDFFMPEMYFEWADRSGVSYPPHFTELVAKSKDVRRTPTDLTNAPSDANGEIPKELQKITSQKRREENNMLKVILALIHEKPASQDATLAEKLALDLASLADGDDHMKISSQTIFKRLSDARSLMP